MYMLLFYAAVVFWTVQQVNDNVNAFLNRRNVPKLFWLSSAASFVSGASFFAFVYMFMQDTVNIILRIIEHLN